MLQSTVCVVITAQHQPDALRTLRIFMGHTTAKAGCVGFLLSRDVTDPQAITISDRWLTRADFDDHVRSAEYRLLLAVIDLSVTQPKISFDDLTHLGGLDVIQALRAPPHTIRTDDGA